MRKRAKRLAHSPKPWRIVASKTPYGSWIIAADSSMVCAGYGMRDERALLNAWRRRVTIWDWLVAGIFGGLAVGALYLTFTKGEDKPRSGGGKGGAE
jgi:hypothetical protein